MLKLENLKKSFGQSQILKGVSIEAKQGGVTVIIGPSGSGKTTLLRCIKFLEKAETRQFLARIIPQDYIYNI